ncbi:MAG: hypothetical protein AAF805_12990 [Planctomycetota bacterium]
MTRRLLLMPLLLTPIVLADGVADANFTRVITVPPDPVPTRTIDAFPRDGVDTSDTQFNLRDGGVLPNIFVVGASDGSVTNVEFNVSGGEAPSIVDIEEGVTVNISGGSIDDLFSDSPVNLSGGQIGIGSLFFGGLTMTGGEIGDRTSLFRDVEIAGGTIGGELDYGGFAGTTLRVTGGKIGDLFDARNVHRAEFSGGEIGDGFFIIAAASAVDPELVISGGKHGNNFDASSNIAVRITGGAFGDDFQPIRDLSGDDFRVDGVPVAGLDAVGDTVRLTSAFNTLSGTLSDGTPFVFSALDGDGPGANGGAFRPTLRRTALPAPRADLRVSTLGEPLLGVRGGEQAIVDGDVGDHFNAGRGAQVEIVDGGEVGDNFEAMSADVSVSGGAVTGELQALGETRVHLSGDGSIEQVTLQDDSRLTMTGGVAGGVSGGEVVVRGGTITQLVGADRLVMSGGRIDDFFANIGAGEFFGTSFAVDGVPLAGLTPGLPREVTAQAGTFSGVLADGTPFSHELTWTFPPVPGGMEVPRYGSLFVTLVPEPAGVALVAVGAAIPARRRGRREPAA